MKVVTAYDEEKGYLTILDTETNSTVQKSLVRALLDFIPSITDIDLKTLAENEDALRDVYFGFSAPKRSLSGMRLSPSIVIYNKTHIASPYMGIYFASSPLYSVVGTHFPDAYTKTVEDITEVERNYVLRNRYVTKLSVIIKPQEYDETYVQDVERLMKEVKLDKTRQHLLNCNELASFDPMVCGRDWVVLNSSFKNYIPRYKNANLSIVSMNLEADTEKFSIPENVKEIYRIYGSWELQEFRIPYDLDYLGDAFLSVTRPDAKVYLPRHIKNVAEECISITPLYEGEVHVSKEVFERVKIPEHLEHHKDNIKVY